MSVLLTNQFLVHETVVLTIMIESDLARVVNGIRVIMSKLPLTFPSVLISQLTIVSWEFLVLTASMPSLRLSKTPLKPLRLKKGYFGAVISESLL